MSTPAPHAARAELAALVADGGRWPSAWRHAVGRLDPERTRESAVLVLFGVLDDLPARTDAGTAPAVSADLDVLLLARATTLRSHAGQVAFPGGRIDPGDDGPVDAALREAVEETGLDREGVEVLGTLGPLPLPVSDHRVTPVLAWWEQPSPVRVVDVAESAHVFRAPVADLLAARNRRTAVVTRGARTFRSPAFVVDDRANGVEHLVWGFTAGVLDALFDRLGWTEPWDASRTVDPL
ncbi:NUDIX domain-containing protein [Sediminihabitans luteus]|uniref:NUDIX domain-containing protein n=1 Tax=Sediminihabitans luteus TaxID=1138585 RepID=A0A2M9CQD0_9CELL|nr:CoA pyrophosphatase [Sediminihabitans luteus]PJJ74099.1 NUDIX domain-containing protein [Sediminihabitans luteus]